MGRLRNGGVAGEDSQQRTKQIYGNIQKDKQIRKVSALCHLSAAVPAADLSIYELVEIRLPHQPTTQRIRMLEIFKS